MVDVRLHDGLGWVDVESSRCAMPADGETFGVAPGAPGSGALVFQVVAAPELVAVFSLDVRALGESERSAIEAILRGRVEHVAFLHGERSGAGVVDGRGPPIVLATAAATLKVVGGWDESVPIMIASNGTTFAVRLSLDDGVWRAEAHESTPALL